MSADAEREPLLSARPRDNSTSENDRLEPGIVSEVAAVRVFPDLLTRVRSCRAQQYYRRNIR